MSQMITHLSCSFQKVSDNFADGLHQICSFMVNLRMSNLTFYARSQQRLVQLPQKSLSYYVSYSYSQAWKKALQHTVPHNLNTDVVYFFWNYFVSCRKPCVDDYGCIWNGWYDFCMNENNPEIFLCTNNAENILFPFCLFARCIFYYFIICRIVRIWKWYM